LSVTFFTVKSLNFTFVFTVSKASRKLYDSGRESTKGSTSGSPLAARKTAFRIARSSSVKSIESSLAPSASTWLRVMDTSAIVVSSCTFSTFKDEIRDDALQVGHMVPAFVRSRGGQSGGAGVDVRTGLRTLRRGRTRGDGSGDRTPGSTILIGEGDRRPWRGYTSRADAIGTADRPYRLVLACKYAQAGCCRWHRLCTQRMRAFPEADTVPLMGGEAMPADRSDRL
jgi:hypothetical protein